MPQAVQGTFTTTGNASAATACFMKRVFLPVASSRVNRSAGQAISIGSPGNPAPAPMSTAAGAVSSHVSTGRPSMRGSATRQDSESK